VPAPSANILLRHGGLSGFGRIRDHHRSGFVGR